jgi:hypothetical protein
MPLYLAHHSTSEATLQRRYGENVAIIDVTSKGADPWVRFSPFYPHGGIPVPLWDGKTAASVEGIWQGLKVFETAGIDLSKFEITTMKNLKRTERTLGTTRGHRAGADAGKLLSYGEARQRIYLPAYRWVLENRLAAECDQLRTMSKHAPIVLLDYETNDDVNNLDRPLSHAALVIHYIEGRW